MCDVRMPKEYEEYHGISEKRYLGIQQLTMMNVLTVEPVSNTVNLGYMTLSKKME